MYSRIAANKRKTFYIIVLFVVTISALGWVFAQIQGSYSLFVGVLIFALVYAFISYFASAKIALGLSGAKPIAKKDAPRLYRVVENLSITAGLPMPKIYIIPDPAPNAFATGRDPGHAVVAATTGLLEMLDDTELEGVMAHELSHVGNYDIRVMGIVLALVTVIAFLSDIFLRMTFWGGMGDDNRDRGGNAVFLVLGLVAVVIAPLIATILQLAVSRRREFLADASGALLTRYPEGLASALEKIEGYAGARRKPNSATAHLFISNPLKGTKGLIANLFSTHPPTAERVKQLRAMGGEV